MIERRSFITGLAATLAVAPAIVRAASRPEKLALINASYQSGNTIVVTPLTATLNVGDVITIDNVRAWHRVTQEPLPYLRQTVVTALAAKGDTSVHIYPGLNDFTYDLYTRRNVDKLPMNRAEIKRVRTA